MQILVFFFVIYFQGFRVDLAVKNQRAGGLAGLNLLLNYAISYTKSGANQLISV